VEHFVFHYETHTFNWFMEKVRAKILVVDDDSDVLTAARVVLRQKFETVETENNPQKLNFLLTHYRYDVILLDMNYSSGRTSGSEGMFWLKQIISLHPQQQVVMITAYGDIKLAVEAMKHGAADFIVKPWENEKLEATVYASWQHGVARTELNQMKDRQSHFSRVMNAPDSALIGHSPAILEVLNTVKKVAQTDANVLLLGENGTGKELIARSIHQQSLRRDHPFIKVDVGSLSATLFESELFGHKKGAFTDAREDRIGRIELAHEGTLFLDEVGNLPLPLQVKLLSVLQNREVLPLGSNKSVTVDIRVICATNLSIHEAVDAGQFREDLLYRINTVEITLPALRTRTEDIPLLARHFLQVYSTKYRKEKTLTDDTVKYLQKYSWPGNVRELRHAMERAVIMSEHTELSSRDFLFSSRKEVDKKEAFNLDDMEKKAIVAAIQRYHGNMSQVAKELGVGRTTLYRKMEKYGIEK
jgi:DNA-binding NtrC family response regulator